jgi:hypothetical protein
VPNCGAPRCRLATVGLRGSPGIRRRGLPDWAGLSLKASWRSLSSARSWRPSLSCRRLFIAVATARTAGRGCLDSQSLRVASHTQGCRNPGQDPEPPPQGTGRRSPATRRARASPGGASWASREWRSSSPGPGVQLAGEPAAEEPAQHASAVRSAPPFECAQNRYRSVMVPSNTLGQAHGSDSVGVRVDGEREVGGVGAHLACGTRTGS